MKILLVDDDIDMCKMSFVLLERKGVESASAVTVGGAKTILRTECVDCVLCDWYFSGRPEGLELHDWVVDNSMDVSFYIVTAMPDLHPDWHESFISKPITSKLIEQILAGELPPMPSHKMSR